MHISQIIRQSRSIVVANSPEILTAIGVAGSLTTAYLTGKASFKAADLIQERYDELLSQHGSAQRLVELNAVLTTKDKVLLVWTLYIPAVGVAALTVTSIVMSNRISAKRAAALVAAYTVIEKGYDEYKEKVEEHFGKTKEQKVRDEIAQDRVTAASGQTIILTGGGTHRCYDMYTGREFESSMETLKKAQNDINYEILHSMGGASLTEFYGRIDLPKTSTSDDLGWNTDEQLELVFSTVMTDKNVPCLAFEFRPLPSPNFFRAH